MVLFMKKKISKKFFVILFILAVLYVTVPYVLMQIDKYRVVNADFSVPDRVLVDEHIGNGGPLFLPDGMLIAINNNVKILARAHSHHTCFLHGGYSYIRVNDKIFYRSSGPCISSLVISMPDMPLDKITEDNIFSNYTQPVLVVDLTQDQPSTK